MLDTLYYILQSPFLCIAIWLIFMVLWNCVAICVDSVASKFHEPAEDKEVGLNPTTDNAKPTDDPDDSERTAREKETGILEKGWKRYGAIYIRDDISAHRDPPPPPPIYTVRCEPVRQFEYVERVEVVRPCPDCAERARITELERLNASLAAMAHEVHGLDIVGFDMEIKTWATVYPRSADRLIHAYAIIHSTGSYNFFNRVVANLSLEAPKMVERAKFIERLRERFEEFLTDEVAMRLKAVQEGHNYHGFTVQNGMPGILIYPEQLGQDSSETPVFYPFPSQRIQQAYGLPYYSQPNYSQPSYSQPNYVQPNYSQPTYVQPTYVPGSYDQPPPNADKNWWLARAAQINAGGNVNSGSAYNPHAAPVYNNPHAAPVYNNPHAAPVYNNPHAAPVYNNPPAAPVWNNPHAAPATNNSTLATMFAFPLNPAITAQINAASSAAAPKPGYNPNPPPGYDVYGNKMIPLTAYLPQAWSAAPSQPTVQPPVQPPVQPAPQTTIQLPASANQPGVDIFGQPLPSATPAQPAKKPTKPWLTKTKLKDTPEFQTPPIALGSSSRSS